MSNLVVWELLGSFILRALDKLDYRLSVEVELKREKHPLIYYLDEALRRFFTPNGGLTCPELKERLEEMMRTNPTTLEQLINQLISTYYRMIYKKKKEEKVIELSKEGRIIYV